MTNRPPDLFSPDRPVRSDFARGGPPGLSYAVRRLITVAVVVGLLGWGGGRVARSFLHHAPGEIPTIKAEGAYKEKPEQPGGIDIPHQDVQLYQQLDAASPNTKAKAERLLPPPEQPNPAFMAQVPVDAVPVDEPAPPTTPAPAAEKNKTGIPLNPAAQAAPVATTVKSAVKFEAKTEASNASPAVVPDASAAAPEKQSSPVGKATTLVQLAALPDAKAAEAMAAKLQTRFSAALADARLRTVRADLGAKGIFYRVQTQALPDSQAQAICKAVKQQNAGCLLVRP